MSRIENPSFDPCNARPVSDTAILVKKRSGHDPDAVPADQSASLTAPLPAFSLLRYDRNNNLNGNSLIIAHFAEKRKAI